MPGTHCALIDSTVSVRQASFSIVYYITSNGKIKCRAGKAGNLPRGVNRVIDDYSECKEVYVCMREGIIVPTVL